MCGGAAIGCKKRLMNARRRLNGRRRGVVRSGAVWCGAARRVAATPDAAARRRRLRQSAHRRLRCPTVGRTPLNNNAQKHNVTRQTQRRRSRRCSRIGRHAWPSRSGPEQNLIYENHKRIKFEADRIRRNGIEGCAA